MSDLVKLLEITQKGDMVPLLEAAKQKNNVALVYPGYFPLEMLEAAGLWPVTFWHHLQTARADAHLPPFACTFSKAFFSFALDNRNLFDAIALSNICDTTQNLYALIVKTFPEKNILWLHLPQNPTSGASKNYITAQIKRIWEQFFGSKNLSDLEEAIRLRNAARAKLSALNEYRRQGLLGFSAWQRALLAYFCAPIKSAIPIMEGILQGAAKNRTSKEMVRLFAVGKLITPLDVPGFLESHGATIVGDSLLFGTRSHLSQIPQTDDPLGDLANSLLTLPASPYHHSEPYDYAEKVVKSVVESRAKGVVVFRLKYCDPDAFDYPTLRNALEKIGIPTLLIEVEITKKLSGTERTRIEAFAEGLKGVK